MDKVSRLKVRPFLILMFFLFLFQGKAGAEVADAKSFRVPIFYL